MVAVYTCSILRWHRFHFSSHKFFFLCGLLFCLKIKKWGNQDDETKGIILWTIREALLLSLSRPYWWIEATLRSIRMIQNFTWMASTLFGQTFVPLYLQKAPTQHLGGSEDLAQRKTQSSGASLKLTMFLGQTFLAKRMEVRLESSLELERSSWCGQTARPHKFGMKCDVYMGADVERQHSMPRMGNDGATPR